MSTIIGLVSTFRLPLHRLDVEAAGSTEEVQKGFAEAEDWTLKRWEGGRKSKRDLQKRQIGR